eukprot:TRINITY_DN7622_c0_g1_i1.p1 TRINITY_DN7622_c0_g1~~TRINITY_DN7622_c0_g1_i1.p1  ORF type:complete len:395 (-),score=49.25 TRINITY_DN7622_c0_g1_i1:80-1264(-)
MASQDKLDDFTQRYPCDEDAINYILNSDPGVQMAVLQGFKPKREGEADYSALVISFTKKQRQNLQSAPPPRQSYQAAAPVRRPMSTAAIPPPQESRNSAGIDLEAFFDRYPCDEDAYNYVVSSPPHVQREIIRSFRPQREGESDYSAIVITYAKRCRNGAPQSRPSVGVTADEYEAFRDRYPFDEDTANYLQKTTPDVLRYVIEHFKPPREGEADYSALLITYCKRCKNNPSATAQPPQNVYGAPAVPMRGGGPAMPFRSSTGCGGYGKGGVSSPLPQTPRYQQNDGRAFGRGSPITGKGQGGFGGKHAGGCKGNDRALHDFRRRIPMDDRAFAYLQESSGAVQREVLDTFAPPREDSDYSALVIGFTKRCRARLDQGGAGMAMPLAKRPRYGY